MHIIRKECYYYYYYQLEQELTWQSGLVVRLSQFLKITQMYPLMLLTYFKSFKTDKNRLVIFIPIQLVSSQIQIDTNR